MKKTTIVFTSILSLFALLQNTAEALPTTYTFNPYDCDGQRTDINDLDHSKFYVWEISNFILGSGVKIVDAALTLTNIYDWTNETNDKLFIHLLDNTTSFTPSLSVVRSKVGVDADPSSVEKTYNTRLLQGTDNQLGGDNFGAMGTLITPIWSDPVGGMPANTITYDFDQLNGSIAPGGNIIPGSLNTLPTLEAYLRNGNNFSFGFDPDCHYYNDKVTFTITVDNVSVPEPATLLLFGTGLAGLMGLRRWKFR